MTPLPFSILGLYNLHHNLIAAITLGLIQRLIRSFKRFIHTGFCKSIARDAATHHEREHLTIDFKRTRHDIAAQTLTSLGA